MQALVYSFIAIAAAASGALAYFALTFTPANALLVAVVVGCACVVLMERQLRLRAENRLERAIEDLSRLLATDAQAGAVLGQRINTLTDLNPGQRLETVEADISVLGTVIRQVAEAVAEMEDKVDRAARPAVPLPAAVPAHPAPPAAAPAPAAQPRLPEPAIPLEALRQALFENRLIHHIQPVVRLPQRRPAGYDLVPCLLLEGGEIASAADFLPRRGGEDLLSQIEGAGLAEAIAIARRSRSGGQVPTLYVPLSRASLGDAVAAEQVLVTLDANRAIAPGLVFAMAHADWRSLTTPERAIVEAIARKGAGFCLLDMVSLRVDVAELAAQGVRTLRVEAARLLDNPGHYTDFHLGDIAAYLARFEVTLLATGIGSERQIVELLDHDIVFVQGDYIAAPGPVRADVALEPMRTITPLRRAER